MARKRKSTIFMEVPDDIKKAWRRAADQSGLTLKAWITLRCNGTALEAMPPSKAA
jgi:hypothetical protein